jgi:hypothetical protein
MAVANGAFAPLVGRIADRYHPRPVVGFGFSVLAIALTWLALEMAPGTPIWRLVLPLFAIGVGTAFVWAPLTATATRNLPPHLAGASSAVFNSIRQLGAVLGSAAIAAFMTSRISAEVPPFVDLSGDDDVTLQVSEFLRAPFSAAMSQSVLLPAFIALFGIAAALFLVGYPSMATGRKRKDRSLFTPEDGDFDDEDDDRYVEIILVRAPAAEPTPDAAIRPAYEEEMDTGPLGERFTQPRPAPEDAWHSDPADSWRGLLDDPVPRNGSIGFAHNGFHVEAEERFSSIAEFFSTHSFRSPADDRFAPRGQHYRSDPDGEPTGYGRHSSGK